MLPPHPDALITDDDWSDLSRYRALPEIDRDRLHRWRTGRLRGEMARAGVAAMVLSNPISLRYAADYASYSLFQSRVPTAYLFLSDEGPTVLYGAYGGAVVDRFEPGRALSYFDGGAHVADHARLLADDLVRYLDEIGTDNRRVAIEMLSPSLTQACLQRGLEIVDASALAEHARLIKSEDEIECIRWAIAVAELGIARMKTALRPGVSELQLWGILNYANLANQGEWHDGRMLASGPRINPWLQEATQRRIESGDLVGFDTDMVGPMGYFCDISRTFHCGPARPTRQQKAIYRLAHDEIAHNMALVRAGVSFAEIQERAFPIPEDCQENAYVCLMHGVGMCDEYPRINPGFRGPNPYDGTLEAGMVITIESYMGPKGARDGVKLEEQVLVTEDGCEVLSTYPFETDLLD